MMQETDSVPVSESAPAPVLYAQLLGDFRLVYGDQPLTTLESPRLQSLLAYLLLHHDAPQSRQRLAFLLFPDSSEAQARTNLRNLLHLVRKALPDADRFLTADAQTLQWRPAAPFVLDVDEFEGAVERASSAAALRQAVNLYAGELLPGCYDDWILPERERLAQRFVELLERLILLLENLGDHRAAISYAERLLRHDPVREETYRHLMRLYVLSGDKAGARRMYQTCVTVLRHELDADPSPETRAAFERLADTGTRSESGLPSGTTTLLFTDIEGSTQLLQRLGDHYALILKEHERLLRAAFTRWNGRVVDTQGDSFFVAFARAADAVAAAVEAQRALAAHAWPDGNIVRVRMGLHTGEPRQVGERYVGLDVHRAARIGAAGHGGQILLSQTTRELVERDLASGVRLKDLSEHHLKDLPHTEHIFQIVASGILTDFPPLKSVHVPPTNLPIQLSSFIGREQQIADLKRLLSLQNTTAEGARLVTLTGAGGSGKTRLAIRVGDEVLAAFRDGVWFIDLAPLTESTLIPQAIAAALSVREQSGRPLLDTLLDYLKPKELLLILDNCEQFVAACAGMVQTLLQKCSQLQIVATSRERLNLAGETVWQVPTLSLPAAHDAELVDVDRSESVRLFIERAVSALPTFALNRQNAPTVAQICRRLDGIPLAIELAAARVKLLTLAQIVARLDDAFRLLTRGSQSAAPRQQTLRAAMDWSYDLLSIQEQMLFRRLSVFAAGFTLESAEQVCVGDQGRTTDDEREPHIHFSSPVLEQEEILDLLSDLVDKSLVVVSVWEQGEQVRYRLLEPVRQYAREKLEELDEAELVQNHHMEFFIGLANERTGTTAQDEVLFNRLEQEHDNLRAALNWALGQNASECALELCTALGDFWERRGYWRESAYWYEQTLKSSRQALALEPTSRKYLELFANVLSNDGNRAVAQGEYETADAKLQESLMIFQDLNNKLGVASVLFSRGVMAWYKGDSDAAQSLLEEYLANGREIGADHLIPHALWILGILAREQGDYSRARALSEDCLQRYRELDDKEMIGWVLENLGCVAMLEGDLGKAHALFQESVSFDQAAKSMFRMSALIMNNGFLAWYEHNNAKAREHFKDALARYQMLGAGGFMTCRCLVGVAALDIAERHLQRATILLGAIDAEIERTGTRLTDIYLDAYDKTLTAARTQLDESTFAEASAKGRAMNMEQAIEYALEQTPN